MHTKKQHIVRKTIIVSVSFLLGIVSTVIAAATYDANIQTRATKMFNTIKSNASTLATADQQAYYTLVRLNIQSLIQVLTSVDSSLMVELGTPSGLDDESVIDEITNTGTTNTGVTNTWVVWISKAEPVCTHILTDSAHPVRLYPDQRALCYDGAPVSVDTIGTDGYYNWKCVNALWTSVDCWVKKIPEWEYPNFVEEAKCRQQWAQDYYAWQIVSKNEKLTNKEACTFPSFLVGEPTYITKAYPNIPQVLKPMAWNWSWKCILPTSTKKKEVECKTGDEYSHMISGGTDAKAIEAGCEKLETFYARPGVATNQFSQIPGLVDAPDYYSNQWKVLSGATMLAVCSEDSKLNNDSSNEFAFEDINKACSSGYHPMERWELDMLAGNSFYVLWEQGRSKESSPRFSQVNKGSVTHWLGDNMLDNNSSYGYIQGFPDMQTPSSDKLRVRCVQNNGVGRDGKSKMELAGCTTLKKDAASGIEYCSSASKLKEDYSHGAQISGEKRSQYTPYSSAEVTFTGSIICPDGYDFPSEVIFFSKIPGIANGAKTYEYGKYKISLTRMANNQYAIRNESEGADKVWKVFTGRSIHDYLKSGYVQDNDLIRLSSLVNKDIDFYSKEGSSVVGWICIKKTQSNDTYNVELSGCAKTKKIWTREICTEFSSLWKCVPWFRALTAADFQYFANNQLLTIPDSRGNGNYSSNIPRPIDSCVWTTNYQHISTNCIVKATWVSALGYHGWTYGLSSQNSQNNSTQTYSFSMGITLSETEWSVLCMKDITIIDPIYDWTVVWSTCTWGKKKTIVSCKNPSGSMVTDTLCKGTKPTIIQKECTQYEM